jgi:hypothetical protein
MIACLRSLEVCFDYRNQSISERASERAELAFTGIAY